MLDSFRATLSKTFLYGKYLLNLARSCGMVVKAEDLQPIGRGPGAVYQMDVVDFVTQHNPPATLDGHGKYS